MKTIGEGDRKSVGDQQETETQPKIFLQANSGIFERDRLVSIEAAAHTRKILEVKGKENLNEDKELSKQKKNAKIVNVQLHIGRRSAPFETWSEEI